MKYSIERELSREEAKQMYENGETIAIVFDKRNPGTRVCEFSAKSWGEPDFDKSVMNFIAKKLILFKLESGKSYEEVTGMKYEGASFFKLVKEESE